jgi:serine/threonine protein kinase
MFSLDPQSVASVIYGGKFGPGGIKRPHILMIYSKAVLVRQRQVQKPLGEAEILSHLSHPFVMKLAGRFQTQDDLILVLENVSTAGAGDLWGLLHTDIKDFEKTRIVPGRRDPLVSLDIVRFYTASLVLAISHMHRHDIAYRNLRPENVLIDARGFIRLISFGNAKEVPFINTSGVEQTKTSTICGSTGACNL